MALASPYPDVEIPDLSVPGFVLAAGKERPDAPALIDGVSGDTITHGQLAHHVDRVAAALHARGLRKGDVVAVLCPNTIWYPVVFHGIAAAGCVMTPDQLALHRRGDRLPAEGLRREDPDHHRPVPGQGARGHRRSAGRTRSSSWTAPRATPR